MGKPTTSTGERILSTWRRLQNLPGGEKLFSVFFGIMVPYSGSISPRIRRLEPGHVIASIKDRRRHRNHLRSVHALALANLGELTSGLAMVAGLDPDVRSIVTRIETEYHKKARGTLVAECRCEIPTVTGPMDQLVEANISDRAGDVVATVRVKWLLDLRST